MLSILLSRLIPYAEEIVWNHKGGFRRNSSTTDHIFSIHQIMEEKWEYNEAVHQPFIDFKKAYNSVRKEAIEYFSHSVRYPHETGKANKIVSD
jgi:hypothetical protein